MIIITLFVLGFSQIMQREQRQSLDRQLSSQALYAAETAVNDVYAQLQAGNLTADEKNTCDVSVIDPVNNGVVEPSNSKNQAAYTCVTYDKNPSYLEFTNGSINTQQSKIFPIQPVGNNPRIRSITFSWNGAGGEKTLSTQLNCSNALPPRLTTLSVPILRIDLLRAPTGQPINRDSLIDQTVSDQTTTFFLYPTDNCAGANNSRDYDTLFGLSRKGTIIPVDCDESQPYACSYTLDQMQAGGINISSDRYFARVKSIYNDADLQVDGTAVGVGGRMQFVGAQISIDATGKSNDVIRRIKVQISNPEYPIPEFVTQGLDGVCKSITIIPPSTVTRGCP